MNIVKSTAFALLMIISLAIPGEGEAKSNNKAQKSAKHQTNSHSGKFARQKSTNNHKKKSNQRSTAQKVNKKAVQTFQKNKNNTEQANISSSAMKHIKDRHWVNANQGAGSSHFSHSMTDQKLSRLAAKTINQGSHRPSAHGQGRSTHQYSFNKPIGTTSNGQKAHSLRVVTDAQNNVITAFPVK